ncbi:MAG: hypothetical protein ACJ76H_11840 [Bacteriovoracaceae bacterium]
MKKVLLCSALLMATNAFALRWDPSNNPSNMTRIAKGPMLTTFSDLPLAATLTDNRYAWSETYWPSNLGGIAYRWNHPDPQPFKYHLNTKEELKAMSQAQLAQLSPAELYDIAQGDYNYTLTRKVLSQFTTHDLWWEGICHGWSQGAANYPEPAPVVVTNRDGIQVPFGSSDVKGLIAMHEAFNFGGTSGFVGKRCAVRGKVPGEEDPRDGQVPIPSPEDYNSPACSDMNAGAFHVVTANMIGIYSRSFVADIDRLNDVWNQPIYGYESAIKSEEPVTPEQRLTGVERRVRVTTKFTYGEELKFWSAEFAAQGLHNFVSKEPVTGTIHQEFRHKDYEYILELDGAGKIIGGEWVTETRPDFMWIFERAPKFKNGRMPLAGLNAIYRPVRR